MKVLKVLWGDFLWLLFCLPFWLINVVQVCTILGLMFGGSVLEQGGSVAQAFLGSYLKVKVCEYWAAVKERANAG